MKSPSCPICTIEKLPPIMPFAWTPVSYWTPPGLSLKPFRYVCTQENTVCRVLFTPLSHFLFLNCYSCCPDKSNILETSHTFSSFYSFGFWWHVLSHSFIPFLFTQHCSTLATSYLDFTYKFSEFVISNFIFLSSFVNIYYLWSFSFARLHIREILILIFQNLSQIFFINDKLIS